MPVTKKKALSLTGVRKVVEASTFVGAKECSEICSALKRFAEIAGVDPESTLADPATLRKLFASHKWKFQELSPGRWSNIKTLVKKGLALAGVDIHRTRANYAVDPVWGVLMAKLPTSDARDLRRFAGVCTGWAIHPDQVDVVVFERFLAYCASQMVLKNPRERWHVARRAWKRAVMSGVLPGCSTIDAPDLPTWKVRSWSELPTSLKFDFDRFIATRTKMRLLKQKQQCLLRPVTIRNYDLKIRTLATCVAETGIMASTLTKLNVLVGPHNLEAGLV